MHYRILGNSGLSVSEICLGAMNFGDTADEKASAAMLEAKAALTNAEIQLGYTTVESPIDGMVSRNLVDLGNLVVCVNPTQGKSRHAPIGSQDDITQSEIVTRRRGFAVEPGPVQIVRVESQTFSFD